MNWMEQAGGAAEDRRGVAQRRGLDVTEEAARYIVSVRFTGLLREDANAAPEAIDETWHSPSRAAATRLARGGHPAERLIAARIS